MKEACHIYTQKNKANSIGLSKFFELRAANIKVFDKIPHNACVSLYRENICQ